MPSGMNPNWPDIRVYVDFTNPGANNTYTWTDITQYCRRLGPGTLMTIDRGRNYERGQTDAGTCNIVVDNSTGVFDPANTQSPFYPNVKPVRKIKVEATWPVGGTLYHLFEGRVEDWPRKWLASGFYGEVTITARGIFSSLSQVDLLPAWLTQAINDGATAIYRLDDPAGSIGASNSSSTQQLFALLKSTSFATAASKYAFAQVAGGAGNLAGDTSGGLTLSPETATSNRAGYYLQSAYGGDSSSNLLFSDTGGWSWECWFQTAMGSTAAGVPLRYLFSQVDAGNAQQILIDITTSNFLEFLVSNSSGSALADAISTTPNVVDGAWHHCVVTFGTDQKTAKLYVDTGLTTNVAGSAISFSGFTAPGLQLVGAGGTTSGCFSGTIKNCAWYPGIVLTQAQVNAHFAAGQGNPGDDTGARIARILNSVPYQLQSLGVGLSTLGGQPLEGSNVVQAMQEANDTEQGVLWEDGSGNVVFNNRQARGSAQSVVTFGEGAGIFQLYPATQITTEAAMTTPALQPTPNSLLVVSATVAGVPASDTLAISDTMGGLSWTQLTQANGTTRSSVFYAVTTSVPQTGIITVTPSNLGGSGNLTLAVYEVPYINTGSPVGATGTSTTTSVSLSAPPAASSQVILLANCAQGGSNPGLGQPLGVTNLYISGQRVGATFNQVREDYVSGSAPQSYSYNVLPTGAIVALEVKMSSSTVPYQEDINIIQDPREIYSTVIVNRNNGLSVKNTDTTALGEFFPRTLQITSYDSTDSAAIYLSEGLIDRYKTPRDRIPTLTIDAASKPALAFPQVLGRDIGDRVTVTRNNPGAPAYIQDFYIEKISHSIGVGEWKTTYLLSPASLWDYWRLGDSAYGVLGSTTKLGF